MLIKLNVEKAVKALLLKEFIYIYKRFFYIRATKVTINLNNQTKIQIFFLKYLQYQKKQKLFFRGGRYLNVYAAIVARHCRVQRFMV